MAGLLTVALAAGSIAFAADFDLDASRLNGSAVRYRASSQLAEFAVPVVAVRRGGLSAGMAESDEIKEKILYPLIERSRKAVAAVVLEWYPGQPDVLGVIVLWSDGETRESLIPRGAGGRYLPNAYETFFAKPTP